MGSLIDTEGLNQHKYYEAKEQAADNSMRSPSEQFSTIASEVLPPEKQQSVLGRDTGES